MLVPHTRTITFSTCSDPIPGLEELKAIFPTTSQMLSNLYIYMLTEQSMEESCNMLLTGLIASSLIKHLKKQKYDKVACSIVIDSANMWNSCIAHYKYPTMKLSNSIT